MTKAEQLRQGEAARQAAVLDALPAQIALLDSHGVIVSVNETWRRFAVLDASGEPTAAVGVNYLEVCDAAARAGRSEAPKLAAGLRSILNEGSGPISIEYLSPSPTDRLWFRLTASPIGDGHPAAVIVMKVDVTGRRAAELALAKLSQETERRERMLTTVVSSTQDFTYIFDPGGRFLFVNKPLLDLWGLTLEAAEGKNFFELGYPEDLAIRLQGQVQRVFETGQSLTDETPYVSPTGIDGYYEYIFSPVLAPDGTVEFVVGSTRDVTERKLADLRLQESEGRYKALVNWSPESIAVSREGKLLFVNPAGVRMMGAIFEDELLGKSLFDFIHPDSVQTARDRLKNNSISGGVLPMAEERFIRVDGAIIDVEVRGRSIMFNGAPATLSSIRDVTERKLAEQGLHDSNENFRQLADNITDAFWIRSADMSKVHYVSPAFETIWGRRADLLYSRPQDWSEFVLPEDRARVLASFLALAKDGATLDIEYRIVRPDGEIRWIRARGFQARDDDGTVIRIIGIITDITERQRAAAELKASEAEFRLLAEAMPQIVWIAGADGGSVYLNQHWMDYTGLTLSESLGNGWNTPFHPDDRQRAWLNWGEASRAKGIYSIESRLRRADGIYRWWLVRGVPLLGEAGEIVKWFGTCTDIHDMKVAELEISHSNLELRVSERRFTDLLANVDMLSVMLDTEARITYCNDSLLRSTGWQREEVIGESWFERFLIPDSGEMRRTFNELLANLPSAWHHENEIFTRSGQRRLVQWNNTLLFSSAGEVIGTASIGLDITESRQTEAQLRQAQKMEAVGQLAAGVAHEFNNLLQALMSMSALLRARAGNSEISEIGTEMQALIKRGAGLTQQLLLFSRHRPIEKAELDLGDQIRKASILLRHLIPETIRINVEISPERLRIQGDAGQIQQVLMNLAINARDAMTSGGTLTLRTGREGNEVFQEVEDTGHGMEESTRQHIFKPFFTTKESGKGTGLGLAVAFGIVEQHGGRIEVESSPGHGSRFRVLFAPAPRESPAPVEEVEESPVAGGGGRVLLVEDDASVRAGVGALLELIGYEVTAVGSGEEAIDLVMEPPPDLLLSDVTLPGIDGTALVERMRERWPALRAVLMSGYIEDSMRSKAGQNRWRFLQKPFELADLARELQMATEQDRVVVR